MIARRNFLVVLCLAMVLIVAMGAGVAGAAQHITFGTASPTGGWMMLASGVAKIINENLSDYSVTPVPSPRGSMENIETIASGEREFGLTMSNIALLGLKGAEPFKEPLKGVQGWFSAHYGYWYLLARADSGIKTVDDLKGKRIAIGNPGDGDEAFNKEVLAALGLGWNEFTQEYSGFSDALNLVKQNQIDALAYVAAPRLPSITELLTTKDMVLVQIDPVKMQKVEEALPYLVTRKMPKSDFPALDMPEEAPVYSINHIVICAETLDEDTMYKFTKALMENIDQVQEIGPAFAVVTPENAVKGMPIPFHPGALKYYKEAGLLK